MFQPHTFVSDFYAVKEKTVRILLFALLGLFVFNHVVELIQHDNKELAAYCCELEEVEELSEFSSRLKTFEPAAVVLFALNLDFFRDLFAHADGKLSRSLQRAFFPHALHVPIYLGKRVVIV